MKLIELTEMCKINEVLTKIMVLNNAGYQVWFEFVPHVGVIYIYYFTKEGFESQSFEYKDDDFALKHLDFITKHKCIINEY